MRTIKPGDFIHVISEPGDFTRYDYGIVNYNGSVFIVFPLTSTFKFPTFVQRWMIDKVTDIDSSSKLIENYKDYWGINPHTLLEVCNCIRELLR